MEVKKKKKSENEEVGRRVQFTHSYATGLICLGLTRTQVILLAFLMQFLELASAQSFNPGLCTGRMDGYVFPDYSNCAAFIRCQSGAETRQTCPPGTFFDLNLHYCMRNNGDCGYRPRLITRTEAPPSRQSHHSVCANVRDGRLMVNPSNCRAYIECQGRLRLDNECSSNEFFDARTLTCRAESAVNCETRQILPSNLDVAIAQLCQGRRNQERVADPRNCDKYFECFYQRNIERWCNPGTLFDESIGYCISASAVRCGQRKIARSNLPQDIDELLSSNICAMLPSGTRFTDPHDCQSFYECRSRQRFDLICPDGQLFDENTHQCRPGQFVECGSREGINLVQRSACSGQRDGARIVDPHNCRSYFECRAGQSTLQVCEFGYLFDARSSECVEAFMVQCGARIIPSEDALENVEDFFPACPKRGLHFRSNPRDCSGYLVCEEGRLMQHFCPAGLHFNPRTIECDLPRNVNCMAARVVIPQTPILPDCYEDDRFFPDLANCQQYYECVDFEPIMKLCPAGRMWDQARESCVPANPQVCRKPYLS